MASNDLHAKVRIGNVSHVMIASGRDKLIAAAQSYIDELLDNQVSPEATAECRPIARRPAQPLRSQTHRSEAWWQGPHGPKAPKLP